MLYCWSVGVGEQEDDAFDDTLLDSCFACGLPLQPIWVRLAHKQLHTKCAFLIGTPRNRVARAELLN